MKLYALLFTFVFASMSLAQAPLKFKISDEPMVRTNQTNQTVQPLASEMPRAALSNSALSEFNYFPKPGAPVVEVQPQMVQSRTAHTYKKSGVSSLSGEGNVTEIRVGWRVSPRWAAQAAVDFGTVDYEATLKPLNSTKTFRGNYTAKGLGDFRLRLKGQNLGLNQGFVYYGAEASLSPSAREIPARGADGNRFTGGNALQPFVGYERTFGAQTLGIQGDLSLFANRSLESKERGAISRSEESGGNKISATGFSEWARGRNILGLSAQLGIVMTSDVERDGASLENDAYQFLRLAAYGAIPVAAKTAIIPSLGIGSIATLAGGSNVDEAQDFNLGFALRFGL